MNKEQPENILLLVPVHDIKWQQTEQDRVVLLRPKFNLAWLKKNILPRLKHPNFRIHLDEFGSWVWLQIDGEKTVYEIGGALKKNFGPKMEPVYERLGLFINQLARNRFITLKKPGDE
jgi:hypothetical protein